MLASVRCVVGLLDFGCDATALRRLHALRAGPSCWRSPTTSDPVSLRCPTSFGGWARTFCVVPDSYEHHQDVPARDAGVTHAQLGSSLRACAATSLRLGVAHRWRPAADSEVAANWRASATDAAARTLTEADVQGLMLVRSGLEHALATGASISGGRAVLPHTLGRTALEHLLRAQHLLDENAEPPERIERRLNEWLYAIVESDYRRQGLIGTPHFAALGLDAQDLGADKATLLESVEQRAAALGLSITDRPSGKKIKVPRVAGSRGRASTMALAETYTAGGAVGFPSFTLRGHSASVHGTEIGLLGSFASSALPDDQLGGVILPEPKPMEVPSLAFSLLGVLLSVVNVTDSLRVRFGWPSHVKSDREHQRARDRAVEVWGSALDSP